MFRCICIWVEITELPDGATAAGKFPRGTLGTGADMHTGRDHGVPDRVKNGEFDDVYRGPLTAPRVIAHKSLIVS